MPTPPTSVDDLEIHGQLDTLPGRPLVEADLDTLNDIDGLDVFPASVLAGEQIVSVFVERNGTTLLAGYSPAAEAWLIYGEFDDVGKEDSAVDPYVELWDERVAREQGTE